MLFIVCSSSLVFSQDDSYKELLVEFMKSQGTLETMDSTFEQLSGMFGGMVDKKKLDAFKKEMFEDLVDVLTPIYKKHLWIFTGIGFLYVIYLNIIKGTDGPNNYGEVSAN